MVYVEAKTEEFTEFKYKIALMGKLNFLYKVIYIGNANENKELLNRDIETIKQSTPIEILEMLKIVEVRENEDNILLMIPSSNDKHLVSVLSCLKTNIETPDLENMPLKEALQWILDHIEDIEQIY